MSLQNVLSYAFEVLISFPGLFPYVCVMMKSTPDAYTANGSLKSAILSAGELAVCCGHPLSTMLMHTQQEVFEVFIRQYVVRSAHGATLTEERSFYAYRIYVCELTGVSFCLSLIFVQ